jgi:carbon-monoxide dehydrogenase catalytic subunit
MVKEGGIGDSFDKLPVVGAAPEWMSEKAIAIGMYFVASGINVVIGQPLPVEGSQYVVELLTKLFEKHFGATWTFQADPVAAAHHMIDIIDRKRTALGLPPPLYEVPYAPKKIESAGAGVANAAEPAQLHDKDGIVLSRACS